MHDEAHRPSPGADSPALLKNIQLLRALAALAVVCHHSVLYYRNMGGSNPLIDFIGAWGFTGVDLFFVISGYVITQTSFHQPRGGDSAARFLKRRLLRIYLGYWPFFLLLIPLTALNTPGKLETINLLGSATLTSFNMFELLLPVSWSLSYELYFYLLFAALLLLPGQWMWRVLLLALAGMLLRLWLLPDYGGYWSFTISPFLLEFLLGVWLYLTRERWCRLRWVLPFSVVAVAGFCWGVALDAQFGAARACSFGLASAALLGLLVLLERRETYVAGRLPVALGDASYTLYLSHLLVLNQLYFIGVFDWLGTRSGGVINLGITLIVAFAAIVAWVLYRLMERPLYRWARARAG